jgi:hypothetical protein
MMVVILIVFGLSVDYAGSLIFWEMSYFYNIIRKRQKLIEELFSEVAPDFCDDLTNFTEAAHKFWGSGKGWKRVFRIWPPFGIRSSYRIVLRIIEAVIFTNKDSEKSPIISQHNLFRFVHSVSSTFYMYIVINAVIVILATMGMYLIFNPHLRGSGIATNAVHYLMYSTVFYMFVSAIFGNVSKAIYGRYCDMLFASAYMVWKSSRQTTELTKVAEQVPSEERVREERTIRLANLTRQAAVQAGLQAEHAGRRQIELVALETELRMMSEEMARN